MTKRFLFTILGLYVFQTWAQKPVAPQTLREADVLFSKRQWRVIDIRQKQNKKADWPKNPLSKILYTNVLNGKLKPYTSDSLAKTYNLEAFVQRGIEIEYIENPIDPNDPSITKLDTIYNPFIPEDRIKQFILMEDIVFDKKRSVTEVRIIAIAPLYRAKVAGIDLGLQPLCWLKFDDRWANETDCRDILKTQIIFNPENSRSTFSFDDWFAQRMFLSYIIKVSNMYDTSILQDPYYKKNGLEALIEAELIKQEEYRNEADRYED